MADDPQDGDLTHDEFAVLEGRMNGRSPQDIAAEMEASLDYVSSLLSSAIDKVGSYDDWRSERIIDLMRIDTLIEAYMPYALNGEHKAADQVRALIERRAKMLGLDAPKALEVSGRDGDSIAESWAELIRASE